MSIIRIKDVAFVRFGAPDLAEMADFLLEFGMIAAGGSNADTLYMRGYGAGPFLHVTERGEPGFRALGLWAEDVDALRALGDAEGVPVLPLESPGGGYCVRLIDPDGFQVEIVAGQAAAEPPPVPASAPWNHGGAYTRQNELRRLAPGPSHVLRLGHVVLGVSDFRRSERWYKDRFGILTSDEIPISETKALGAFMRCDRGSELTDHHSLFLLEHPEAPKFLHAAFEVHDFDDLMTGHDYLLKRGRTHNWGIGRHIYGSQIFDYWADPWGHEVEHWTDGDRLTAYIPPNLGDLKQLLATQWGAPGELPPELADAMASAGN
jgi:catechol 2,3-dioxygenase-like lactoylglutathione lyase family enzyme